MNLKKPQTVWALVGLIVVLALAYVWQRPAAKAGPRAQAGAAAAPSGPVTVEVRPVQAQALAEEAQAVGTLRAKQSVVLRAETSGRVVKLNFVDGQRVRAGQLLVQLDDALQQAQLRQAQAQAQLARTQLQRNRDLLAQNFVSASAVDQAASTLEVAEAQVALARAQLQRLQVLAPFDGVMGLRAVHPGDYVKDSAELVAIEDNSTMWVDFSLPERFVPLLRQGQALEVQLDALPGQHFAAKVEASDVQLDATGRALLVRARLQAPDRGLRSGQFARVRLALAVRAQAVVVPEEALVPQGGKQYLFKVVARGQDRSVQRLEARLGQRASGMVEVLEGLRPGDEVVTAGQAKLMRGEPPLIRVVDVDRVGQAASAASAASR
ncbi:efflux RND transporter periplasmic adaptor subunit [Roseateles sp. BYS180W]|uniref:Efflux RND transporter periplasmic adaptor subunit n=1 Tax=Roseateles rivi TaxID=3299028 RepID=A0ABW7FVM0_9BURK